MSAWKIHCKYDTLLSIDQVENLFHPDNPNEHPEDQTEDLARILEYQGWRYAIKISNLSGKITSGHGRVMAAQFASQEVVPVVYQDYEDEEQEYADIVADNAIAERARLSRAKINDKIQHLGPDFEIKHLGFLDFKLDASEWESDIGSINKTESNLDGIRSTIKIECEQEEEEIVKEAICLAIAGLDLDNIKIS